ncbi:MAG: hypothetical protein ACOZE5_03790 [Verrucomicrobiota bacterium]
MKWLIVALVLVLAALGLHWQLNTTKISYVNGLDAYAHLPNQEFILVKDCYVFAWRKPIATAYPLLGVNAPDAAASVAALPRETSRAGLAKSADDPVVRLMDFIPQGTRFRLLSVRREESRRTGTLISYEIKFLDEVDRPYQRVDIRPILLPVAQPGDAPQIDPAVAVPWIKR